LSAFGLDGNCSSQASFEIVSTWVGLEEIDGTNLQVYPNPTSGTLMLSSDRMILTWEVLDTQGRIVASEDFTNLRLVEINTFDLKPGLYTLNVSTETGKEALRFIRN